MAIKKLPDEYLGDGVYASYDGYHIWLDVRAQAPGIGMYKIALEPEVLEALDRYRTRVTQLRAAEVAELEEKED